MLQLFEAGMVSMDYLPDNHMVVHIYTNGSNEYQAFVDKDLGEEEVEDAIRSAVRFVLGRGARVTRWDDDTELYFDSDGMPLQGDWSE